MVSDRDFSFHMCIPYGKTFSLIPRSMSSVKVKYHGLNLKKRKKCPFQKHSCLTNASC